MSPDLKLAGQINQIQLTPNCECLFCEIDRPNNGKWRLRFVLEAGGREVEDVTPLHCRALYDTMEACLAVMKAEGERISDVLQSCFKREGLDYDVEKVPPNIRNMPNCH